MTSATTAPRLVAAALVAAVGLATGSASAGDGPIISAGTGCALQCIEEALVTTTATSALVELKTTVLAHLEVSIAKQAAATTTGGLTAPQTKTVSISAYSAKRTASFAGLEPETTYTIVVEATDLNQQTAYRKGTFETLPVKAQAPAGPTTLDSGLGCAAQCIEQVAFTQIRPAASVASLDLRTATDAKIQLVLSRDKPVATAAGPSQLEIVAKQSSPGLTRSWRTQVGGLLPGTRYWAVVRAKDAEGRTSIRQGSFRTVSATAVVTLHKLKVLNDGDKGRNKGELHFRYEGAGEELGSNGTFQKIRSVSTVDVRVAGQSRPGMSMLLPANGDATLDVRVRADECDAALKKNCVLESGGGSADAVAGGRFDLAEILEDGALPRWYGTGVAAPPGHDGYFVLATSGTYVDFVVLATLDLRIDWP